MRKRRVGVTARSWRNVGKQATEAQQFGTEMAAPLELRTPAGTCGKGRNQSADGSMASKARGSQPAEDRSKERMPGKREGSGGGALRALEALPQTPPGGKPPETPAPFPWALILQNGVNPSRVRKPRRSGAPLTDCLRSEERAGMRERGPCGQGQARAPTGGGTARYARMRRCLILRQGAGPLRPPMISLDTGWPSHGSRDREGAVSRASRRFAGTPFG
jgi:hypothetical protein